MALSPRDSAEFIYGVAKHVKISEDGINNVADLIIENFQNEEKFSFIGLWDSNELNPKSKDLAFVLDWIFTVDTLNFSFWAEKNKPYSISFKGKSYTGYWSLCAAINRALEEGYCITSPDFYADVSFDTLKHIFRTDDGTEIPLLKERQEILNEAGNCLREKFNSTFATCVSLANSAAHMLEIIVQNFESYRDEAIVDGQKVSFYKRAQILIADIWLCFEGEGCGKFQDINELTMFADYRVPQVLVYLGALVYSEELQEKLKNGELLVNGDRYEVEIRGCTIWAVELILRLIKKKQENGDTSRHVTYNSILIDYFLWEYRRSHAAETDRVPFHRVRCTYY